MRSYVGMARLWLPLLLALGTVSLLAVAPFAAAEPGFTPIGIVPPVYTDFYPEPTSRPLAISADGTTIIGRSRDSDILNVAFRWTADEGLHLFPTLRTGTFGEWAQDAIAISGDGSVVLLKTNRSREYLWSSDRGYVSLEDAGPGMGLVRTTGMSEDATTVTGQIYDLTTFEQQAAVWFEDSGWIGLGQLSGGVRSVAEAVNASGEWVVGSGVSAELGWQAAIWNAALEPTLLGDLSGGTQNTMAEFISRDGSAVVGRSNTEIGREGFIWTAEEGIVGLGAIDRETHFATYVADLSHAGEVVVGRTHDDTDREAFVWTRSTGMIGIGGGAEFSDANAVSSDGSFVVGGMAESDYHGQPTQAFIWEKSNGIQDLTEVLIDHGLELQGWILTEATHMSPDGRVITGVGINPASGWKEAWVAELPKLTVAVDIEVESNASSPQIDLRRRGLIPVVLFGSPDFAVVDVDISTLSFGPTSLEGNGAEAWKAGEYQDRNLDGFTDLITHYPPDETGITIYDASACLNGSTLDGVPFEGCSEISVRKRCRPDKSDGSDEIPEFTPVIETPTAAHLLADNRTVFTRGRQCDIQGGFVYCWDVERDDFPGAEFADWDHYLQHSTIGTHSMSAVGESNYTADVGTVWSNSVFDVTFEISERTRLRLTGSSDVRFARPENEVVARISDLESIVYESKTSLGPMDIEFDDVLEPGIYRLEVFTDILYTNEASFEFKLEISPFAIPIAPDLDILPKQDINPIQPSVAGVIPVAILGSETYDVSRVDIETLAFGPAGVAAGPRHIERTDGKYDDCGPVEAAIDFQDVNRDGYTDLITYYQNLETGLKIGDTETCLHWQRDDGIRHESCDEVDVVAAHCGLGFELLFAIPFLMQFRARKHATSTF